ncbi:type VI secretion system baseplate subunit TssF, partial [Acinetobacter baumannii]
MSHYHNDTARFFYSVNYQKLQSNFVEMGYSIISKNLNPFSTRSDFISTKLLCSNRDLPHEALGQSNNVLNLNDSSLARRAIVLKRPTKPYKFEQGQSEQWRVISHLSLNSLAL